jgi:aryl-alcohol dehydrogenase-like predicted oxidoreductase
MERQRGTYPCGKPRPALEPTRRQFVKGVLVGAAAVGCAGKPAMSGLTDAGPIDSPPHNKTATDRVVLGNTGIEVSRLAMGSGTHGSGGSSDQTRLGVAGFAAVLTHGYDKGIRFFETADQYGAHPHVAEAIRQVGRQNVVVLTKTTAQTAAAAQADLDRFRRELGVEMIDIVLLHNKQSGRWTTECAGAMDTLSRAKETGVIRAHGVSCHTLAALQLAAQTPWVDVDLARINPDGILMDSDPATVIGVLRQMKASGKGVIGMKILGEGALRNDVDRAIQHAVALDTIDAFTIGFTSNGQLDEVMQKIAVS